MTNQEYLEKKGTCIHTGDIGLIEAIIRLRCIIRGINFDDATIETWLEDVIPIYERKGFITVAEVIRLSIGCEYEYPEDRLHGFSKKVT